MQLRAEQLSRECLRSGGQLLTNDQVMEAFARELIKGGTIDAKFIQELRNSFLMQ